MPTAAMWTWLGENSGAVTVVINFGLLIVWAFYLDLFVRSHRRARRCKILISLGGQEDLKARCLLSNMSAEPVYILKVGATVETGAECWSSAVTEYGFDGEEPPNDPVLRTRQGPLLSGQWRDIGSLSDLLERARDVRGYRQPIEQLAKLHQPSEIELTVVAYYGSDDLPVGARRRFRFTDGAAWQVQPVSHITEQIRGKRARRRLQEL